MTAGTAKVACIPCWRSISRNAANPWLAPNSDSGVARSAAVRPSAPEATLRSTVTATQQRAPSGQRISESARLLSSQIVYPCFHGIVVVLPCSEHARARRMAFDAIARDLFAGGEPDAR